MATCVCEHRVVVVLRYVVRPYVDLLLCIVQPHGFIELVWYAVIISVPLLPTSISDPRERFCHLVIDSGEEEVINLTTLTTLWTLYDRLRPEGLPDPWRKVTMSRSGTLGRRMVVHLVRCSALS